MSTIVAFRWLDQDFTETPEQAAAHINECGVPLCKLCVHRKQALVQVARAELADALAGRTPEAEQSAAIDFEVQPPSFLYPHERHWGDR